MDTKTSRRTARVGLAGQRSLSAAVVALACLCAAPTASAVPADYPLLTRTSSQATPNVVFTFDDSGSMAWRFMPDSTNISTTNGIRWKTTFHPSDTLTFGNTGDASTYVIAARPNVRRDNSHAPCPTDTSFSDCVASDLVSARMRSSAYNTLYYNPEIRYQPWYYSNGTQYAASPASGAWLNPTNHAAGTVDLVGNKTFNVNTVWCRSDNDQIANTTDSADKALRGLLGSSPTADRMTCNAIPATLWSFDTAACTAAGGTWNSGSTQCRFTAAQGATSGNCAGTFGGAWNTTSPATCRVSAMGSAYCTNKLAGTWASPNCRKDSGEELAPAVYYTYSGTTAAADIINPYKYKRVRIMDLPATGIVRGAGRTDCAAGGCTRDQEYQNFANWFTYYRTRNYLSIAAASKAFSEQGSDLRIGYGRINNTSDASIDGSATNTLQRGVRNFTVGGADRTAFFTWLHAVPASGGTPLRRAMDDIGQYFSRTDNAGPWGTTPGTASNAAVTAHLQCRKSYHILMTDGYWNGDDAETSGIVNTNVDNITGPNITGPSGNSYQYSAARPYRDNNDNTLADVAMYYWNHDLRPDLANRVPVDSKNPAFWQHMVNFTVGLGVNGTLNSETDLAALQAGTKTWPDPGDGDNQQAVDDLWHAAVNSRGEYLSAKDPDEFAASLSGILEEIQERTATEAGVAAAASTLQVGNRKYAPEYRTAVWSGKLYAYSLGLQGDQQSLLWEASTAIPDYDERNIFLGTRNGSPAKAVPFTWNDMSTTLRAEMGTGANAALVDYLRGDDTLEDTTYRNRASKLGDIVNSQPIYVRGLVNQLYNFLPTGGAGAGGKATYRQFVSDKLDRAGLIMVGANDGMLHAFNDEDGSEAFAFIPRILLPKLSALSSTSYGHYFYVDGQLTEGDFYNGSTWKNVVVGSNGAGERGIFAIDVTDYSAMDASKVMWELDRTNDSDLGYVLAPIETGVLRDGSWVAIFGNGSDSTGGNAKLFIVNLSTGAVIKKITAGSETSNGLGGVRVVRDSNRYIVGAYAGDLKGKVWKFDLSSNDADDWGVAFSGLPLFTMPVARPIVAAPQYLAHPEGGYMVLIGSGKLYEEGDQTNTDSQFLYGLWDKQQLSKDAGGNVSWTDASPITSTDSIVENSIDDNTTAGAGGTTYYTITAEQMDWSTDRGWKLPLDIVGGHRNLLSPQFAFGLALFETMSPSSTGVVNPCDSSGTGSGYNLLLDPLYGAMPGSPVYDTDGDGDVDADDATVSGPSGIWDGRDVVLFEPPCTDAATCEDFTFCEDGSKFIAIVSTGSTVRTCRKVPPSERWWWRALQDIPQ